MEESSTPRRLSRRTIAKGAAWTVPAVAVVSPTPAMASSHGTITLTGANCKLPGSSADPYNDGAVFLMTVTNTTNAAIDIVITGVTRGTSTQAGSLVTVVKLSGPSGTCCTSLSNSFSIPANSSGTYALVTRDWGSSANQNVSVAYTVDTVVQTPATGPATGNLNPFTPNVNCGIGGSCTALTEIQSQCILRAIGVLNCASAGNCS